MVLVVPLTYLVSINAESGGQKVTNVIGVRKGFSTSEEISETVLAAWTAVGGPIKLQQTSYIMRDVSAMWLGAADGEVYIRPSVAAGVLTDQKSTNAACALVNFGATTRSRTTHGRLYFGPLSEPQIFSDGRTLASATQTAILAAFNQFKTQLAADGMEWVVVSRKNQSAAGVANIGVSATIATQRRRIR